ncbi:hypothetical protein A3L01_00960 [Thermococcus barossii]|uniref:Uncharacterized protein n=1 Tax=Thermococcus barossii TaxID=54077 RepID=A0A2Z2MGZ9_9EURY|nr:hypothetical protein A3L01_00960 [Thermococcus barossii]
MSLLALTGMFIFGGKKEKKKKKSYEEILKDAEERFGVPADTIKELANLYVFNASLPRLVRHAHPEKDLEHVMRITGSVDRGDYIHISSILDAKWHEKASNANDPRAVKFVLLHPFIALILSHHSSAETSTIGRAVSDALNVYYGQLGKTYEDAKKEQDKLIEYILAMAEYNHIPIVKEKLREQLRQGLPKAFKIVDKLLPDNSKEHAILLQNALRYRVKDPLVLLKQAGIDIEPELEEFRGFLAEISGKKMEAELPKAGTKTGQSLTSADLAKAKLEVLSIINGLEFAGYSDDAKAKAIEKLSARIAELSKKELTPDSLQAIGLYAFALEMIKTGAFERLREVDDL